MARVTLDKDGYDLAPHQAGDGWYYEEPRGLEVYNKSGLVAVVSWSSVVASAERRLRRMALKEARDESK